MKYDSYGAKLPANKTKENQQANVGRQEMDLGRQP